MKICFILGHFPPHVGGGENFFMDIVKGLLDRGHRVRVVTSNSGSLTGHREYNGVDAYYYPWKMLAGHPLVKRKDLVEHVKWSDIVHTTTFTPGPVACSVAKRYHKPIIITVHEVLSEKWYWIEKNKIKAFLFREFERFVVTRKYDFWHVDSDATLRDIKKLGGGIGKYAKRIYLPTELDADLINKDNHEISIKKYFNVDNQCSVFLFYGRPGQSKGIFVYLEAIRILKQMCKSNELSNIRFLFLMSDDPRKQKEIFLSKVDKYGLQDFVKIKSSVKREWLISFIKQADYIVVPSITEGFGLSAVEACILNKKLICSDGGSLPEVVFGEVLHFKNRDSVDLANLLEGIIQGKKAFIKISEKKYMLDTALDSFLEIYKKLIKGM